MSNDEGQHSLCPSFVDGPAGRTKVCGEDTRQACLEFIEQNRTGSPPLSPGELAKRTILWVSIGILAMIFITFLLAQYNMRWIARRAAARRK